MARSRARCPSRLMRIEALDPRLCLSVDPVFDEGVLTVSGSPEADAFSIADTGRGLVVVEDLDSGDRWEFRNVRQIIAEAGAGDDRVRFTRQAGPAALPAVDIRLGEGADGLRASANLAGETSAVVPEMKLDVSAGEGDDTVGIGLLLPAVQKVRTAAARMNVELGGGNNEFRLNTSGVDDVDLDLSAGEGNDSVLIGMLLPAVQKVREAAASVGVRLGAGNDRFQLNAPGVDQLDLDLSAGAGADSVLIGLLLPAVQKVREAAARMNVDLGEGDDHLELTATGLDHVTLDLLAGAGSDTVQARVLRPHLIQSALATPATTAELNIDLGSDGDRMRLETGGVEQVDLDLTAGEGDDNVLIGMLLPAVQKVRESAARMKIDLGVGNDRLQLGGTGAQHVGLDLTAGEGDDNVAIGLLLPAVQKVRESAARMNIDLGGGNDHLRMSGIGYKTVDLAVAAGEGDDELGIGLLLPAAQKVKGSIARVKVDLGPGSDHLQLRVRGYETVEKEIIDDDNDVVDDL